MIYRERVLGVGSTAFTALRTEDLSLTPQSFETGLTEGVATVGEDPRDTEVAFELQFAVRTLHVIS